jgi:hypothetical protein
MPLAETQLRTRARALIQGGQLPALSDGHVWGGPGSEKPCCLCGAVITRAEIEYEIADPADPEGGQDRRFQFHLWCHSAWQEECAHERHPSGSGRSVNDCAGTSPV